MQTPEEVEAGRVKIYEGQLENYTIITGTPTTVIPKIRHVLETLRPGQIFFWDGDGAMSHEDAMRSLKLMGEEIIPAVREMGRELELPDAFEIDPATNQPLTATPAPAPTGANPPNRRRAAPPAGRAAPSRPAPARTPRRRPGRLCATSAPPSVRRPATGQQTRQ